MKKYLQWGLAGLLTWGALSPALAASPNLMSVASYNIRNLFDGIPNPGNKTTWKERAKPEKEIKAMAEVIRKLNADVIAFQEVESLAILDAFREKHLQGMGYHKPILIEGNDGRGIDVALMTRFKVKDVYTHKDVTFPVPNQKSFKKFSRDLLGVTMQTDSGYEFTAFVAHLKSKHGGKSADIRRKAEAREVYHILNRWYEKQPNSNFLLLGDFNDTPKSDPLSPLFKGSGKLKLKDITAMDLGIRPRVYTYHPKKYRSRIDYIMVSPGMMPEYKKKSVYIFKSEAALTASDHLPLVAQFQTTEVQP